MLFHGCSKVVTVLVLILALIGVFIYNIVDYDVYVRQLVRMPRPTTPQPKNDTSSVADKLPLRVMFIGASITRGEVSTGDRGYRKQVRDALVSWGNPVNSVGFNRFGDWNDNDVEGWGAYRIRTITKNAAQSIPALQPNLIIVQVGTSDCFQNDDTANIGSRYRLLADTMMQAEPRATMILSTLVTTPDPKYEPCILSANEMIRNVTADLISEKKPVVLSEMHYDQGLPDRPTPQDIGPDNIHPTDQGYAMMGNILLQSIREVEAKEFLQRPGNNSIPYNGDDSDSREIEDRIKNQTEAAHPINRRSTGMMFEG
ncbi:SGNH hydrolase-type esterase domain-containing protein [Nemania sp. FL0916]|nr:SGNH hydrolase-type esterase domain-containing protein [Nemania sp. FL0916]